jgi:hypothetical protein
MQGQNRSILHQLTELHDGRAAAQGFCNLFEYFEVAEGGYPLRGPGLDRREIAQGYDNETHLARRRNENLRVYRDVAAYAN